MNSHSQVATDLSIYANSIGLEGFVEWQPSCFDGQYILWTGEGKTIGHTATIARMNLRKLAKNVRNEE